MSLKRAASPSTDAPEPKKVNPSTLRNKRWAMMPQNKAKRADSANVSYYVTKLKKSVEYQQATEEQKALLLAEEKQAAIDRRLDTGRHASIRNQLRAYNHSYMTFDDDNSDWEDYEDPDELDVVLESRYRQDDVANGEVLKVNLSPEEKQAAAQYTSESFRRRYSILQFRALHRHWNNAIYSLKRKIILLNGFPMTTLRSAFHPRIISMLSERTLQAMILEGRFPYPHEVFTFTERAVWRSFWSATPENENISLPGPAEWWENYDMARYGFVGEIDAEKAEAALALMAKEYDFANPNFKVPDEQLEDSLANLALL